MVINILSNRSEWTFYFLSSVQFNFTISEKNLFIEYPKAAARISVIHFSLFDAIFSLFLIISIFITLSFLPY
ncbi:hypothetical protein E4T70_08990 [Lactobacillus johnsonii]|nr:hypothetical protein [Lactobacillus johnsonii]TFU78752.1 hypothetical protein E4T70_08990 [Lactobacillus johnsonii]